MRYTPAHGLLGHGYLLATIKAWKKVRLNEKCEPPEIFPAEVGGRHQDRGNSTRVLVVDDNPMNLLLVSAQMESRGFAPLLAADGAEAVALACELHFDLILMDLQMPILDGFGATAEIRRFERDSSRLPVPVVAFSSALPDAGVLSHFGMNGILAKPCGEGELEDCLVRWCPTYCATSGAASAVRVAHDHAFHVTSGSSAVG